MIIFLLVFLAVILQITSISYIKIFGVAPNLTLVILALIFFKNHNGAVCSPDRRFLIYPIITGLILDFFSNLPFGIITLILFITFILSIFFRQNIFILIFSATLIYDALLFFLVRPGISFLKIIPIEIIYNILLGLIIFYPIRKFLYNGAHAPHGFRKIFH